MLRRMTLMAAGLALSAALGAAATEPAPFKLIVNAKSAGRTIGRDAVAQVYLGKAQRWGDGSPIVAVDLSSTSPVRQAFSETVLAMSVEGVKNHWLRLVLSGDRRPPVTKRSDEDVIAFVAAEPGGIGYVSEATPLPTTVRAVALHQ
jgi:ABC-type phosphate transport system substrate-binding protein